MLLMKSIPVGSPLNYANENNEMPQIMRQSKVNYEIYAPIWFLYCLPPPKRFFDLFWPQTLFLANLFDLHC